MAMSLISPCPLVSSTNNSDRHDITEKLLKVELNTISITPFSVDGDMSTFRVGLCAPCSRGTMSYFFTLGFAGILPCYTSILINR